MDAGRERAAAQAAGAAMRSFRRLDRAVVAMRLHAATLPLYTGHPSQQAMVDTHRALLVDASLSRDFAAILLFTRDGGHHTGGWWKNPDYERCYHLSMSFRDFETMEPADHQHKLAEKIARAFYGDNDARKLWIEAPYSEHGRRVGVYHYRLFCDEGWQPIVPRGEVYSRELTEAGWKSWSDLHGGARAQHHGQENEP